MVCGDGSSVFFAMKCRHGTGIKHTDSNHGPLSDKSDPFLNLLATALKTACHDEEHLCVHIINGTRNDKKEQGHECNFCFINKHQPIAAFMVHKGNFSLHSIIYPPWVTTEDSTFAFNLFSRTPLPGLLKLSLVD